LCGMFFILAQLVACEPAGGKAGQNSEGSQAQGSDDSGGFGCECLEAYASPSLDEAKLQRLRDEGLSTCFHVDEPATLESEQACLPQIVGQHGGNGRDIEVYYLCSDVCPEYGRIGIRFVGIKDTDACCAIGGIPVRDPAWGGFEACVPHEIDPNVSRIDMCP
ncbi:MAG TPA: hypothetical protein PK156_26605, partial [Polyangium sp.]|nr:hypothetical protein [Polyangium sp.]